MRRRAVRRLGLEFLAGMGEESQQEFGAAPAGPAQLQDYLEREASAFAGVTGAQVAAALRRSGLAGRVAALRGDVAGERPGGRLLERYHPPGLASDRSTTIP